MSFDSPGRLALLLTLAVLFWLARPPRLRQRSTSAHLARWRAALARLRRAQDRPRRLRFWLLVAATGCAALAAAGPRFGVRAGPRVLVAILDTSPSMGAREPGTEITAFDAARAALHAAADRLPADVELRVVIAGAESLVLRGPRPRVLSMVPEFAETRRGPRTRLDELAQSLAEGPDLALWTLTDGCARPLPDSGGLSLLGSASNNRGIVDVVVRDAWPLAELEVELTVFAPGAASSPVLELSGAATERQPTEAVPLDADQFRVTKFLTRGSGGLVRVVLRSDVPDALDLDDAVEFEVAPPSVSRIAILRAGSAGADDWLGRAARLLAEVSGGEVVEAAPGATMDLLLVEGGRLEQAPALALSFGTAFAEAGSRTTSLVVDWDRNHPLLRGVDLSELVVRRALGAAALPSDGVALIEGEDGPLAVVRDVPGARSVHFAFRLEDSNLPWLAAFPQLLLRTLGFTARTAVAPRASADGLLDAAETDLRRPELLADRPIPELGSDGEPMAVPLLLLAMLLLAARAFT